MAEQDAKVVTATAHRVVALALPDVVAFDLSVTAQVFGRPEEGLYDFEACGVRPGKVPTTTGFALHVDRGLEALAEADTVLVPGFAPVSAPPAAEVVAALRAAHARGARVGSICTGAFALAHTGLLDGRRATTHWAYAERLADLYPAVDVDARVLYIDEGEVVTSAGVAAGIDLCLHLVRRDHGVEAANAIARRIVVAPHRDGGQAQFVDAPLPEAAGRGLAPTRAWALHRLHEPLTVAAMAAHARVSERTFARRFRAEAGTTPLQWLLRERVLHARRLLEATDLPVEDVAGRAGFGTATSLRAHFRRATATTPLAYRRSFRGSAAA
jgi:transcriptional regulator GlxA family with amidase domain